MSYRPGTRDRDPSATLTPPYTITEVITRRNALAALPDAERKALAKACGKKHTPDGGDPEQCFACGTSLP